MSLEGAKRTLSKPTVKKSLILASHLDSIIQHYGSTDSVKTLRVCTLCVLGYAGFFRFNEIGELKNV